MVACRQHKAVKKLCSVQILQLKQQESKNQSVGQTPFEGSSNFEKNFKIYILKIKQCDERNT